mmetsp:Transcript_50123/g.129239  ORF Transcript_50123/g.129239 Transcript_50123/m.129239 type:complete len:326 (-) Transcript_50123:29-1006(-)
MLPAGHEQGLHMLRAAEKVHEVGGAQGGGHDHDPQTWRVVAVQCELHQAQQHIGVDTSLMRLVQDHNAATSQPVAASALSDEHAVRHVLQPRVAGGAVGEAHVEAHEASHLTTHLRGDTVGDADGGDSPRLRHRDHATGASNASLVQELWDLSGLTTASLADDHDHTVLPHRRKNLLAASPHWQVVRDVHLRAHARGRWRSLAGAICPGVIDGIDGIDGSGGGFAGAAAAAAATAAPLLGGLAAPQGGARCLRALRRRQTRPLARLHRCLRRRILGLRRRRCGGVLRRGAARLGHAELPVVVVDVHGAADRGAYASWACGGRRRI